MSIEPKAGRPANHSGSDTRLRRAMIIRLAATAVILITLAVFLHGRIHPEAVHRYAARLNGPAAFALLVVLPLLGFPASVLHVAAGIRFGIPLGLSLVAASIGLQLLASYALVHRFRGRFARRFQGLQRRIPRGAHASICVFAVLLPGAPYFAVNYVLPLIGVRLRTFLLCCWPLDILRAIVTVLLGGEAGQFTPARLVVLAAYALLLAGGSWWLYQRVRRQLADPPPEEDGRMQPV